MTRIAELEQQEILALGNKKIPAFSPGDTLRVLVNIVEGERKRVQAFEGVCIARKNASLNSSFTVRKISCGEGVERVFPLYSPLVTIEVVRQGAVRRAKLYFLRGLTGKKARIKERPFWLSQRNEALDSGDIAPPSPNASEEKEIQKGSPSIKTSQAEAPSTSQTAPEASSPEVSSDAPSEDPSK